VGYVAYGTRSIDAGWVPSDADVVVVHNDDLLDRASVEATALHIDAGRNVGFGAAVNLALAHVSTDRVVLCNPDTVLTAEHCDALLEADVDEIVTVPLVAEDGVPTSVTSAYPTPLAHLASGLRLGRVVPRGSRARGVASRALGPWGRAHSASLQHPSGAWPLSERWVSGAVLSVDTRRLRAIGGFDEGYFLYYEDVDVCARLARRYPMTRARVAPVTPGRHAVGGSSTGAPSGAAERARLDSAIRYAHAQTGPAWRTTATLLALRRRLSRRSR
jgi:GT2 family glycosyltransferase